MASVKLATERDLGQQAAGVDFAGCCGLGLCLRSHLV